MPFNENIVELNSKIKKGYKEVDASYFKSLDTFVKIIEAGSFSEAARRLQLTPSAVSKALAKLEEYTGVTLIKRTTRSMIVTEPGQFLYEEAVRLLAELDESFSKTKCYHSYPQGQLKITCSFAFATSHLMTLISKYKKIYPSVDLLIDLNDQLVNLNEVDVDLALRITYSPPQNYATRQICPINWAYCASPEYLEAKGEPHTLKDLEKHDCLVYPRVSDAWQYLDEDGHKKALNIRNVIQANSSAVLLQAALMHQGIVYLPTYVLGDYIQSGKLKPLLMDERINVHNYYLYALYFPSRYRAPKVRTFIDFVLEELSPFPPWDAWMPEFCTYDPK